MVNTSHQRSGYHHNGSVNFNPSQKSLIRSDNPVFVTTSLKFRQFTKQNKLSTRISWQTIIKLFVAIIFFGWLFWLVSVFSSNNENLNSYNSKKFKSLQQFHGDAKVLADLFANDESVNAEIKMERSLENELSSEPDADQSLWVGVHQNVGIEALKDFDVPKVCAGRLFYTYFITDSIDLLTTDAIRSKVPDLFSSDNELDMKTRKRNVELCCIYCSSTSGCTAFTYSFGECNLHSVEMSSDDTSNFPTSTFETLDNHGHEDSVILEETSFSSNEVATSEFVDPSQTLHDTVFDDTSKELDSTKINEFVFDLSLDELMSPENIGLHKGDEGKETNEEKVVGKEEAEPDSEVYNHAVEHESISSAQSVEIPDAITISEEKDHPVRDAIGADFHLDLDSLNLDNVEFNDWEFKETSYFFKGNSNLNKSNITTQFRFVSGEVSDQSEESDQDTYEPGNDDVQSESNEYDDASIYVEKLLPQKQNTNIAQSPIEEFLPSGDYKRLITDTFYHEKFKFFYRFRTLKEFSDLQSSIVSHYNSVVESTMLTAPHNGVQDVQSSNSNAESLVTRRLRYKQTAKKQNEASSIHVKYLTFGKSGDRKSLKPLRVLQFGNPGRGKHVFIIAGIRGCEWVPSLAVLHTSLALLGRESVKKILDAVRFHVIAIANPDGYEYSRRKSPSSAKHWCKNRRLIHNTHGVDLSKNFGNDPELSSLSPSLKKKHAKPKTDLADTYNFSEPESFHLREYISHFVKGKGRGAILNVRCCSGSITPPRMYLQRSEESMNVEAVATLFSKLITLEATKYSVTKRDAEFNKKFAGNIIDWAHSEGGIEHAYELNLKASGLTTRTNHNLISEEPFVALSRDLERAVVLISQLLLAQPIEPLDNVGVQGNFKNKEKLVFSNGLRL